jgi:multidrug efflux pump subunit AcrA (membrane-fusion protein)
MVFSKSKFLVCLILAGISGFAVLIENAPAGDAAATNNAKLVLQKKPIKLVSPRDGVILVVGTEKPGEKIPAEERIVIRSGPEIRTFKKLREGDRVEAEQIVARLDDRLARIEVERARSKLAMAELEVEASGKVLAEAKTRWEIVLKLLERRNLDLGVEEIRERKLGVEKFEKELGIKKEMVSQAKLDLRRTELLLDMHLIRSPVRGVIRVIHKNRGEAVKALEPVVEIVPDKE